ncbi:permease [Desulfosporosinus lacus]|uniref:Predicted permease n=1 Tax=Desulfosporosinus lacus DSM 15449 TaxID=1121420 RepID=A0A1M5ZRR0_9FIRM|nr:permease [Desulfosporosinus lacus]SHI26950.1 Predicted permease [Desulfosporosinus lacus DSM 15449]
MKMLVKRYKFFLVLIVINIVIYALYPTIGQRSINITWSNTVEMLSVIPPIFILLGLLDVWVQRETMIKLMGEKSGILGILIAFFLGSAAAGPLYAAFPMAGVLLKKGSKFSNVLIFIGAWSTTKIPMLLFEASALGWMFMITRFVINIPGIILIAYITEKLLNPNEKQYIFDSAGR